MNRLLNFIIENRKIVFLTFELFWIAVFLLRAIEDSSSSQVAQFVYVNF